jgi:hypothetical protein
MAELQRQIAAQQPKPEPVEPIVGPGPELTEEKKSAEADDWLDKLDNHQELQSDEENELKELEKFRESEAAKANSAPSDLSPAPTEGFPAQEPIVETPSTVVNPNPPTESALGPSSSTSTPDESATEELTPL